jgi:hypothetical protein
MTLINDELTVNPNPLEAVLLPLQTGAILAICFKIKGYLKPVRAHAEHSA